MAQLFTASEYVDSESKETTPVKNPATGEIVDTVPKGTVNDIRRAIDVAKNALPKWSQMAPSKRGAILLQAGHLILEQEKELATLLTAEETRARENLHRDLIAMRTQIEILLARENATRGERLEDDVAALRREVAELRALVQAQHREASR